MGRKSAKAKDKKLKRKEEDARVAAVQASVEAANQVQDPMLNLEPFKKFERNGLNLKIQCQKVALLDLETVDWAFKLVKDNMQALYEECDWGWNDKNKREEMTEEVAWYLIARNEQDKPQALVHFRFEVDNDVEVLYCYEIQLDKEVRRKGLGKFLMQILGLIALKHSMKKVMLTVFKHNTPAQNFFREKMGYEIDETSPEVEHVLEEEYCYHILSKSIGTKKPVCTEHHANGHRCSLEFK